MPQLAVAPEQPADIAELFKVTNCIMTPEQIASLPAVERVMAREIAKRKLMATFNGNAWHIRGAGVDVKVSRLRYLAIENLKPPAPGRSWRW